MIYGFGVLPWLKISAPHFVRTEATSKKAIDEKSKFIINNIAILYKTHIFFQ